MSEGAKFADLQTRVISAIIMLLIGGVAIWMGGYVFSAVIVCAVGAMHWELGRMLTPLSMQAQWFSALTSVISIIWLLTTDSLVEQVVILTVATLLQRVYFHTVDRLGTLVSAGIIIGALLLIYVRNDVGIIHQIMAENRTHHENFVLEARNKQRANGSVDQARGQRLFLGRTRFALEKATGNLARGIVFLLVMYCQREKVLSLFHRLGECDVCHH